LSAAGGVLSELVSPAVRSSVRGSGWRSNGPLKARESRHRGGLGRGGAIRSGIGPCLWARIDSRRWQRRGSGQGRSWPAQIGARDAISSPCVELWIRSTSQGVTWQASVSAVPKSDDLISAHLTPGSRRAGDPAQSITRTEFGEELGAGSAADRSSPFRHTKCIFGVPVHLIGRHGGTGSTDLGCPVGIGDGVCAGSRASQMARRR
jgi:hypothetical protein